MMDINENILEHGSVGEYDRIEYVDDFNLARLLRSIEDKSTDPTVKREQIRIIRSRYNYVCELQRQVENQPLKAIGLRAEVERRLSVSLTDGTAPVNRSATISDKNLVATYLSIMNGRFDRSYFDEELDLTHFHMACLVNLGGLVWEFLWCGQDPNCLVPKTGDSPLHLALANGNVGVAELLIKSGADPNLSNEQGSAPLHVICQRDDGDDESIDRFFKMCDDRELTLQLDARDKMDRTPLQLAVVHNLPHAVDVLLARGADLASFEFPKAAYFAERFKLPNSSADKLAKVSRILAVVRNLEKAGFQLDHDHALIIMNYLDWCRLLDKPADFEEFWGKGAVEFGEKALSIVINSWLSLHDLIQLNPQEAENLIAYTDYCELSRSEEFSKLPVKYVEVCVWRLCNTMASGFFQRWALEPYAMQMRKQMGDQFSIDRCKKILETLSNRDLRNICLAKER
uniref:Ankyrin repeat protein n=1 Tax=Trichogramma kaykai TaxID=54128 RepID=A0ABD2XJJ4_9HYME